MQYHPQADHFVHQGTVAALEDVVALADLERDIIVRALEINDYNQSRAARFLRIPRHVLLYRIEKYDIPMKGARG